MLLIPGMMTMPWLSVPIRLERGWCLAGGGRGVEVDVQYRTMRLRGGVTEDGGGEREEKETRGKQKGGNCRIQ